jgi:hypothetical protein
MSNALFDKGRERFLTAVINWSSDTIKVILVNTGSYTVNLSTHEYYTDVTGGAIIAGPVTLASKTTTSGAAGAANCTFSSVSGSAIGAIIIYKDTGTGSTSPLIAYIDTATGLPITPNGGDIIVTWDTGANKIFKL